MQVIQAHTQGSNQHRPRDGRFRPLVSSTRCRPVILVPNPELRASLGSARATLILTFFMPSIWLEYQLYHDNLPPGGDRKKCSPSPYEMEPFGPDIRRAGLREVMLPARPRHLRSDALLRGLLAGLTILGLLWLALAASALWQLVTVLDAGVTALTVAGAGAALPREGGATSEESLRLQRVSSVPMDPLAAGPGLGGPRSERVLPSRPIEEPSERPRPLQLPPLLAYGGSMCTDVFVYIVTIAEDSPRHSAASFATQESARARFVRPGESVGGWELLAITDDWTGVNPVVWLIHGDQVCRTGLTGNVARVRAALEQERQEQAEQRRNAERRRKARRRRRR